MFIYIFFFVSFIIYSFLVFYSFLFWLLCDSFPVHYFIPSPPSPLFSSTFRLFHKQSPITILNCEAAARLYLFASVLYGHSDWLSMESSRGANLRSLGLIWSRFTWLGVLIFLGTLFYLAVDYCSAISLILFSGRTCLSTIWHTPFSIHSFVQLYACMTACRLVVLNCCLILTLYLVDYSSNETVRQSFRYICLKSFKDFGRSNFYILWSDLSTWWSAQLDEEACRILFSEIYISQNLKTQQTLIM